jgi:hypothetical protein
VYNFKSEKRKNLNENDVYWFLQHEKFPCLLLAFWKNHLICDLYCLNVCACIGCDSTREIVNVLYFGIRYYGEFFFPNKVQHSSNWGAQHRHETNNNNNLNNKNNKRASRYAKM